MRRNWGEGGLEPEHLETECPGRWAGTAVADGGRICRLAHRRWRRRPPLGMH